MINSEKQLKITIDNSNKNTVYINGLKAQFPSSCGAENAMMAAACEVKDISREKEEAEDVDMVELVCRLVPNFLFYGATISYDDNYKLHSSSFGDAIRNIIAKYSTIDDLRNYVSNQKLTLEIMIVWELIETLTMESRCDFEEFIAMFGYPWWVDLFGTVDNFIEVAREFYDKFNG
ncbi:MAG: hypothetical protein IJ796_09215 [Lachnospiraceae bacterium]|nr:hypothetical protein [Lachnospiraceae bacterium]